MPELFVRKDVDGYFAGNFFHANRGMYCLFYRNILGSVMFLSGN